MRRFLPFCFLTVLLLMTPCGAEERILHRNKQPKLVSLRPDDVTTIMGYRAELSGSLRHAPMPGPQMYKQALVYNFTSTNDSMVWRWVSPNRGLLGKFLPA